MGVQRLSVGFIKEPWTGLLQMGQRMCLIEWRKPTPSPPPDSTFELQLKDLLDDQAEAFGELETVIAHIDRGISDHRSKFASADTKSKREVYGQIIATHMQSQAELVEKHAKLTDSVKKALAQHIREAYGALQKQLEENKLEDMPPVQLKS